MEERLKEIYRNLEEAIATENETEAEKLVDLLAEEKGMTEEISMPKDFVKQIRRKEGRKVMAGKGRMLKAAAAGLATVCAIGGTAYAATHWNFDEVQFTDSGVMAIESGNKTTEIQFGKGDEGNIVVSEYGENGEITEETDIITGENVDGKEGEVEESSEFSRVGSLEEPDIQVIEEQDGTKDTNWSHKVTELVTTPTYRSDDGVNWEKDEESKYQYTSYMYDTWDKLRAEKVMPNIFSEKTFEGFALEDSIIYKEGYQDAKEEMTEQYLDASYTNGKKKIEANLRVEKVTQETEEEECAISTVIASDDGKAENQRFYTTKEKVKYALEDVTRNGGKSTFAYLSGNGCAVSLFFTNMTEEEIENVLEHIDATVLLEEVE